jgi:multimeric flavodoxin WrbA
MKILAIIGSPRKGNTYKVVNKLEQLLMKNGKIEFNYLFLKDAYILCCKGCFQCFQKGSEYCPLKDDKEKIVDEMLKSSGIIFASPAYNFNVTSLMKNFIDRLAYNGHRPQFINQHVLNVVTTAGVGLKEVFSYMNNYVSKIWGFRTYTNIGFKNIPYKNPIQFQERDNRKIELISKVFYKKILNENYSPRFYHIDQFCTTRALWTLNEMKDAFSADYNYYIKYINKMYYDDRNINKIKYIAAYCKAQLLKGIIRISISK